MTGTTQSARVKFERAADSDLNTPWGAGMHAGLSFEDHVNNLANATPSARDEAMTGIAQAWDAADADRASRIACHVYLLSQQSWFNNRHAQLLGEALKDYVRFATNHGQDSSVVDIRKYAGHLPAVAAAIKRGREPVARV